MPPIRNARSPNSTTQPSKDQNTLSAHKLQDQTIIVDGITHGWHYQRLYKRPAVEFHRTPDPRFERPTDPRPPPLKLKDLECVRTLGKGGHGRVLLVRTTRNAHPADKPGSLFALKVTKKKVLRLRESGATEVKNYERRILMTASWSPFLTTIIQTFYDERNVYTLSELTPSGTLRSLISSKAPFPPSQTLFYLSNIVCALSFLAAHDIAHRDVKPDNFLVDVNGYLTLIDFGIAVTDDQEADWVMMGTPCYQSPETLTRQGQTTDYSKAVDWWSTGCIVFEMATRRLAFRGVSKKGAYQHILAVDYKFPPNVRIGKLCKSFISGLLTLDAAKRLGANGPEEVKNHPWLSTIRWGKVRSRQYLAPYIPVENTLPLKWQSQPLPSENVIPGLTVVEPPLECAYDDRFPDAKELD